MMSAQDMSKWGKHQYIWDFTEIDIAGDLGIASTVDIKSMLNGSDLYASMATLDGEMIDHAYLTGKIVILDFWYIGCPPCRRELPALSELSKLYPGKEVVILSLCRDSAKDIREHGLDHSSHNVHIIPNAQPRSTGIYNFRYPFKALVDTSGELVYSFLGAPKTNTPVDDLVADLSNKIEILMSRTSVLND